MTPDKLSEMIANYMTKDKPKSTYIVNLTPEEKAFYDLTAEAWGIDANSCSSPNHAGSLVLGRMRELAFPVWCLEDVDTNGVYDLVKMYMTLVQSKGDDAHDVANEIGKIAIQRPSSAQKLKQLLTVDNCRKGMELFIQRFEGGRLLTVAKEIGASGSVLADIKKLFSVQYSALWIGSTGEDEIRKLIVAVIEDSTVKKIVKEYEKYKKRLDIFHVAFSGGKDSAVLLDLIVAMRPVMTCQTRAKPPMSPPIIISSVKMPMVPARSNLCGTSQRNILWIPNGTPMQIQSNR